MLKFDAVPTLHLSNKKECVEKCNDERLQQLCERRNQCELMEILEFHSETTENIHEKINVEAFCDNNKLDSELHSEQIDK